MREVRKEYLLFAALFTVITLTCTAVFFTMPSLEYMLAILGIPTVVYLILKLGEKQ